MAWRPDCKLTVAESPIGISELNLHMHPTSSDGARHTAAPHSRVTLHRTSANYYHDVSSQRVHGGDAKRERTL